MDKLSIIIPVYNGERSIRYLLDDLSGLEISHYEVIIVNDGSTDTTESVIQQYLLNNSHIKLVNQQNKGVSSARNHGMRVSEGKYITFLDADDRINPLKFKEFFYEVVQAGAEYSFTGYIERNFKTDTKKYVDSIGNGYYELDSFMNVFFENLKVNLISYPINKVFLKSIIEENHLMFDENIHFAEDLLFNLDYLNLSNSFYISDSNYYIYQKYLNENSLSSKFNMGFWESRKLVYEKLSLLEERAKKYKLFNLNKDTYAANVIVYTSRQIVNQNKPIYLIIQDLKMFVKDEYLKKIISRESNVTSRQKFLFDLLKKNKTYSIYFFWKLFEFKDKLEKLKSSL